VTFRDADVRNDGSYRTGMQQPNKEEAEKIYSGNFLEVVPPEKLVFEHHGDDTPDYSYPHTTCTEQLKVVDGKTEMRFTQVGFNVEAERDGHNQGWSEIFDKLGIYVQDIS